MRLAEILGGLRNTVTRVTGRTPAEIMMGRRLTTIFDRLKPDPRRQMRSEQEKKLNTMTSEQTEGV